MARTCACVLVWPHPPQLILVLTTSLGRRLLVHTTYGLMIIYRASIPRVYLFAIYPPRLSFQVEPPAVKIPGPISSLLIGSTQCSPSHDSIPPPPPPPPPPLEDSLQDSLEDSPLKMGHDHKKAIKKGEKLSKKMRQLSESGRMRKDMTEKVRRSVLIEVSLMHICKVSKCTLQSGIIFKGLF